MSISTLARIVADKAALKVVTSTSASTFSIGPDAEGTYIMTCPGFAFVARENCKDAAETLIRGGVAHEALGHGRHTDFGAWRDSPLLDSPFGRSVQNVIEDIRIERLAPETYPGAAVSLKKMAQLLEAHYGFWNKASCPEEAFMLGVLRKLRTDVLRQDLPSDVTNGLLGWACEAFGAPKIAAAINAALPGCYAKDTAGAIEASKKVLAILTDGQPEPQPKHESRGGRNNDGDDDDDDAPGGGRPKKAVEARGRDGREQEGNSFREGRSTNDDRQAKQERATASPDTGEQFNSKGFDAPNQAPTHSVDTSVEVDTGTGDLGELLSGLRDPSSRVRIATINDLTDHVKSSAIDYPTATYDARNAGRVARLLQSRLRDSLAGMAEDEDDGPSRCGFLDTTRLAKASVGLDRTPFLTDGEPGREVAIDLFVLFDGSSSMGMPGVAFLRDALHGIGTALASFSPDVTFGLALFDNSVRLLLRRTTRWTPAISTAVVNCYTVAGGTDWPASALACMPFFGRARGRRRVLFTVTDGDLGQSDRRRLVYQEARAARVELATVSVSSSLPDDMPGQCCGLSQRGLSEAIEATLLHCMIGDYA